MGDSILEMLDLGLFVEIVTFDFGVFTLYLLSLSDQYQSTKQFATAGTNPTVEKEKKRKKKVWGRSIKHT
jgi:hypothetical protein